MNDFDYDCLQKKRLARNAYARKGTKNRKGCRLPHENLTKKEREALNGEVKTVGFNDTISWEFFKALPKDLQEEYLQKQIDRFGAGLSTIGTDLFGLGKSSLHTYTDRRGLKIKTPGKGIRMTKKMRDSWERWLGWQKDEEPSIAPVSETAEEPDNLNSASDQPVFRAHDYEDGFKECGLEREAVEQPEPTVQYNAYPATNIGMTLKGTTVELLCAIQQGFASLMDPDKNYRVQIQIDDYVL